MVILWGTESPRSVQNFVVQGVNLFGQFWPFGTVCSEGRNFRLHHFSVGPYTLLMAQLHKHLTGLKMTSPPVLAKTFKSFADLARFYRENEDYRITCLPRNNALVCIVAPHGGGIEPKTSDIARAIAGSEFSLYLFEGICPTDNYEALHLTSHYFDEPGCLKMLASSDYVLTIHGCSVKGEAVLIGGLDNPLANELFASICETGVKCEIDEYQFPASNPNNICNRGRRKVGVQLELSRELRQSPNIHQVELAVRRVLLQRASSKANQT